MIRMPIVGKSWLCPLLFALPLLIAGADYASSQTRSYICPLTGKELPCPQCCPLNHTPCDQCDDGKDGR